MIGRVLELFNEKIECHVPQSLAEQTTPKPHHCFGNKIR